MRSITIKLYLVATQKNFQEMLPTAYKYTMLKFESEVFVFVEIQFEIQLFLKTDLDLLKLWNVINFRPSQIFKCG